MICENCKIEFKGKPAISRVTHKQICPLCGNKEALMAAVEAGAMTETESSEIIELIIKATSDKY